MVISLEVIRGKKFCFTEKEAILTAGFTGLLFEVVAPLRFLDPLGAFFLIPLSIFIYTVVAIIQ